MREIPECLNRRYRALDEMIQELSSTLERRGLEGDLPYKSTEDPGIELMCKFWNILKEDPECDLTNEVEQRMRVNMKSSGFMLPQSVACYMAPNVPRRSDNDKQKDLANKVKSGCCTSGSQPVQKDRDSCCGSKSPTPSANADPLPLSKVLCNLKEAASFDKKCNARLNDLMMTQKELQEQITHLEHREREGTQLLKQAECMWSCMEESYKKKVAESTERQQGLMKHLKEVEKSATKWRKNKKEVESQVYSIHKCQQEIIDKINQKTNDIKCMDMEIEGFKKKIESNKKEISGASQLTTNKKQASTAKVNGIATQVASLQKASAEAAKHRYNKEGEGGNYIKEAREDLQKICRLLLQKKLENEDLRAEKDALLLEIDLLKQTCDQCKDRCKNKQTSINDEIKEVEQAIASFKVKCIRCHECTDTIDIRKFCTDCPKCAEERDCLYENDHCNPDTTMDCVCMSVKNKFLDNVFDNMYTVLERQARTAPGKAVAEQVLECLKRSRNGKLNEDTRRLLQDFILTTVKKNLNLTIVGGAVKTRCEMDPETYQQLMTCLKKVKAERPPKADKGTTSRKDPCRRWGATSECNCPKGPKACICTRKAPPPPQDPTPCPPKDKEDAGEEVKCPFKGTTACGPDCAMHAVPSLVGTDVAAWRPDPCQGQSCPFSKNMRAAQCVLGPESLVSLPKSKRSRIPDTGISDELIACKCGKIVTKPCSCRSSRRSRPRDKLIEEVFGKYTDVSPIEKVTYLDESGESSKGNSYLPLLSTKSSAYSPNTPISSLMSFYTCSSSGYFSPLQKYGPFGNLYKTLQFDYCENRYTGNSKEYGIRKKSLNGEDDRKKKLEATSINAPTSRPEYTSYSIQIDNVGNTNSAHDSYLSSAESKNGDITETADIGTSVNVNDLKPDLTIYGREVCDTVKELIKDVIVCDPEIKVKNNYSNHEWITVESLIKEIKTLTDTTDNEQQKHSNSTINEVEIADERLSHPKIEFQNRDNSSPSSYINIKIVKKPNINLHQDDNSDTRQESHEKITEDVVLTSTSTTATFNWSGSNVKTEKSFNTLDSSFNFHDSIGSIEKHYDSMNSQESMILNKNGLQNKTLCLYELTQVYGEKFQQCANITKAGIVKNCDKSTCVILSEQEVDNIIPEADLLTVQDFSSAKVKESNIVQNVGSSNINLENVSEKNKALDESTDIKLTYTSSGNIAVEIDENIIYLIERRTEQDPALVVSLKATESGHFFVYFQKNEDVSDDHHLIRIKKTLSGSRFLEVHKNFIQSLKPQNISNNELVSQLASKPLSNDNINLPSPDEKLRDIKHVTKEVSEGIIADNDINLLQRQFFKVRVKRIDNTITELPVILKLVTSRNYEVVIDKEFEKRYINAIQESLGHEMVCSVNLTTTASNNYLIDLQDTCLHASCKRALLKRSLSGHLRMDINGSKLSISSISPTETLSQKVLEELLNKLLPCKVIQREMLRKPKLTESKATSDSYLYEKVKIKLNDKILFNEPSAALRKTSSGQLAVVLNKESKKAFINNLKSYISNKPHGLIPIKRTESGEIVIDLSHDEETKTRYGSLKITPSGNIYVSVDECVVQEIMKREHKSKVNESTSLHLIEKNKDPTDKAVTTTCHAKPEEYACDVAKCICDRLQIVTDNKGIYNLDWRNTTLNKDYTCTCCGQNKSPKDWYANNKTTSNEKAPHIVIKPCTCRSVQELKRNVEQCYFVVETICPFHKNRYDSLSNELLEITGPCNKPLESIIKESKVVEFTTRESLSRNVDKEVNAVDVLKETELTENWDSLQYLPPQLPPFLKDVNYRQYQPFL